MGRIEVLIPFPPSANSLWRVGRNKKVYKSEKYQAWLNEACLKIIVQSYGGKVKGKYKLYVNAVRPDKRKRDLDNLIKPISDVLQMAAVIEGDHLCEELHMQWVEKDFECHVIIDGVRDGKAV